MATAVESFGSLNNNYSDFSTVQGAPSNFEDCVTWNLMDLENANYTTDRIHAVRASGGGYTATIGYGLDIDTYGTWLQVRELLVYGLGGENSLTAIQLQGLDILSQYRDANSGLQFSAQDIANMANPNRPRQASDSWTQAQADAISSIRLSQEQAELVLRAVTFGNAGGVTEAESKVGYVRYLASRYWGISDLPESTELASMTIMAFRGSDITGYTSGFQEATDGARRAEYWWRIVNKIESVSGGVINRLALNANMFGVLPSDASAGNNQSALEAMSLLSRKHLEQGLGGAAAPKVKDLFRAAITEGVSLLKGTYAPDGGEFDVVQLAKSSGELLQVISFAENNNLLRNLMVGSDSSDTLIGGGHADYLWGMGGADSISGGGGEDYIYGGEGNDTIYGGANADILKGGADNDELHGESGKNQLFGEGGSDTLHGGDESDYLDGGEGTDYLYGGAGYDVYVVDDNDVIQDDSNGFGRVQLHNKLLTGGVRKETDPENTYKGGGNTYVLNGTTLVINGGLTINDFTDGKLGIFLKLDDEEEEEEEEETPETDDAESRTSPIVLDLDGDGVETLELGSSYFDLDGDGLSERSGWVSPDDGLLVSDLNGDGLVSSGAELFGNHTLLKDGQKAANGFQALAEYDDNGDGKVDAQDASYVSLQVWRDLNGNGISDVGELQSLADANVVSISTDYSNSSQVDAFGHEHRQVATVVLGDGTASTAADVWFKVDAARRVNNGSIALTPDVVFLANAKGFGKVHDLHQAMVLDSGLKDLLNQYLSATDSASRDTLLDDLIYRWAGAADVDPYSRDPKRIYGHVMDARQLVTLENLVGKPYEGTWCWGERDPNPHGQAAPILVAEYLEFKRFTAAQILAQTEYASELDIIRSHFGSDARSIVVDWDALQGRLEALFASGRADRIQGIVTVLTDLGTYSPSYRTKRDAAFQAIAAANSDLAPFFDFSTRVGTSDNDTLYGVSAGTIFHGLEGDDRFYGRPAVSSRVIGSQARIILTRVSLPTFVSVM